MIYGYIPTKLTGKEPVYNFKIKTPETFEYSLPKVLNQGNKPICVPCSISAFLNWDINVKDGKTTRDNHINIEQIFQHGGSPQGMIITDALDFLISEKKIKIYGLIKTINNLKSAILLNGPCIGALPVYHNTDLYFWRKKGDFLGGHAIAITGWTKQGLLIRNSWGTTYGIHGYTILPFQDFKSFYELWTLIN